MGITVEIVPPRGRPICVAHHLYTVLTTLMVVGLPMSPVGVAHRSSVTPVVTSICRVVFQTDPLGLPLGVRGQEALFLHVMDADKVCPPGDTVFTGCRPTLLLGEVHHEELQQTFRDAKVFFQFI